MASLISGVPASTTASGRGSGRRRAPAATTRPRAQLSEYGLPMPTSRVEPIVSTSSADENRKSAQGWIAAWRAGAAPASPAAPAAPAAPAPAGLPPKPVKPSLASSLGFAAPPPPPPGAVPLPSKATDPWSADNRLATITGGVSLALGLLYLLLVLGLNSRGDTLLPPPPEAFMP